MTNKNTAQHILLKRPCLWLFIAFSIGIVLAQYRFFSFGLVTLITVFFLVGLMFLRPQHWAAQMVVLLIFVALGMLLTINCKTPANNDIRYSARYYRQQLITLEGVVVSDVEKRKFFSRIKTTFVLNVKQVKVPWGWQSRGGKVLVNIFRDEQIHYGDYIRIEGKLHRPFEFSPDSQFSYRDYLARQGIPLIVSVKKTGEVKIVSSGQGSVVMRWAYDLKHHCEKLLYQYFSSPEAGILQAMLLGDQYNIPKPIQQLCVLSGVAHVFAISGFNVGIVSALILLALKMLPIPRKLQYLVTIILLIFYALLTGARPPVVRATIMTTIFLFSFMLERETYSLNTLALAGLVILMLNPLTLFDVGFQLSFICVFSILYFYPRLMRCLVQWPQLFKFAGVSYLIQSTVVSLTAWLGAAGLIAFYFHIITPVAVLANFVVIPLISLVNILAFGFLLAAAFCPMIAYAFVACINGLLFLTMLFVVLVIKIPGAYLPVPQISVEKIITFYLFLLLFPAIMHLLAFLRHLIKMPFLPSGGLIDKKDEVC